MNKKLNFASFLRKIPFVRILIPFILGIVAELYWVEIEIYPVLIVMSALLFLLWYLIKKQDENFSSRWVSGLSASMLFMGFGMLFTANGKVTSEAQELFVFSDDRSYLVEVTDVPRECDNSIECFSNIYEIEDSANFASLDAAKANKVVIYVAKDSMSRLISMGDVLLIGNCRALSADIDPWDDAPFYHRRGGKFSLYVPQNQWTLIGDSKDGGIFERAEAFRRNVISYYKKKEY